MRDADCVRFLRWALPRLGFRWAGFRRVRRQVCRRIQGRLGELGLPDVGAYRELLERDADEWEQLAPLCRVTISRFFRDRELYRALGEEVLPALAALPEAAAAGELRIWSAGCGAGEEPYSLALLGHKDPNLAGVELRILGTDLDPVQIARARRAVYPESSLRDLPQGWREGAFEATAEGAWRLGGLYRRGVELALQDLRSEAPAGPFAAVLCRNLAFTYFAEPLRDEVLERMRHRLIPGGALVVGGHETLPATSPGFAPWSSGRSSVWRLRRA